LLGKANTFLVVRKGALLALKKGGHSARKEKARKLPGCQWRKKNSHSVLERGRGEKNCSLQYGTHDRGGGGGWGGGGGGGGGGGWGGGGGGGGMVRGQPISNEKEGKG